jgi:hypothetical protein
LTECKTWAPAHIIKIVVMGVLMFFFNKELHAPKKCLNQSALKTSFEYDEKLNSDILCAHSVKYSANKLKRKNVHYFVILAMFLVNLFNFFYFIHHSKTRFIAAYK